MLYGFHVLKISYQGGILHTLPKRRPNMGVFVRSAIPSIVYGVGAWRQAREVSS